MSQFIDTMAEVDDETDESDNSDVEEEMGAEEWAALINDETEEPGSATEEEEAKFTDDEVTEKGSPGGEPDPLWDSLISAGISDDEFSSDQEEKKTQPPPKYSPTPPPQPSHRQKFSDGHAQKVHKANNTPPTTSDRQPSPTRPPQTPRTLRQFEPPTPPESGFHLRNSKSSHPSPQTNRDSNVPSTPTKRLKTSSSKHATKPSSDRINQGEKAVDKQTPTGDADDQSENRGEDDPSTDDNLDDEGENRGEEDPSTDDNLDDEIIRKKRIEEHAIQEGLLSRKRIRGRFNKKVPRKNDVDRDRLRLALGITSHKHSHRIRKKCRELLDEAGINLVCCWAEMTDEERVKAVNVLYSHFNPIFSWWTVGLVRDLTMVVLRDNKRNTTSKEKGYKSYSRRDKEYAPRRKPKYAPTVMLQRSEKKALEKEKRGTDNAASSKATDGVSDLEQSTKAPLADPLPKAKVHQSNPTGATDKSASSPTESDVLPATPQRATRVPADEKIRMSSPELSNDTGQRFASVELSNDNDSLDVDGEMEYEDSNSSRSRAASIESTSTGFGVYVEPREDETHLGWDTVDQPLEQDTAKTLAKSASPTGNNIVEHSLSPVRAKLEVWSDTPNQRSTVDREMEIQDQSTMHQPMELQDPSMGQKKHLMLPPGFVPPRPQKAVLRIEFVVGMYDFSSVASFTSPLCRHSTLKEFLLTVEQHIHPAELDVSGSLLCYLPASEITRDGLNGNWKVIKGTQDLIEMFASHANGTRGVYMCQVESEKIRSTYWKFVDSQHYDRNAYARKIKAENEYEGPLLDEDIYDMSELAEVKFERSRKVWFPDGTCRPIAYEEQLVEEEGCDEGHFREISMGRSRATSFVYSRRATPTGSRAASKLESLIQKRKQSVMSSRSTTRMPDPVSIPLSNNSQAADSPTVSPNPPKVETKLNLSKLKFDIPDVSNSPFFGRAIAEQDMETYFSVSSVKPAARSLRGDPPSAITGDTRQQERLASATVDLTGRQSVAKSSNNKPEKNRIQPKPNRNRVRNPYTPDDHLLFASPAPSEPVSLGIDSAVLVGGPVRSSLSGGELTTDDRSLSLCSVDVDLDPGADGLSREESWLERLRFAKLKDRDKFVDELLLPDFDLTKIPPKFLKFVANYFHLPTQKNKNHEADGAHVQQESSMEVVDVAPAQKQGPTPDAPTLESEKRKLDGPVSVAGNEPIVIDTSPPPVPIAHRTPAVRGSKRHAIEMASPPIDTVSIDPAVPKRQKIGQMTRNTEHNPVLINTSPPPVPVAQPTNEPVLITASIVAEHNSPVVGRLLDNEDGMEIDTPHNVMVSVRDRDVNKEQNVVVEELVHVQRTRDPTRILVRKKDMVRSGITKRVLPDDNGAKRELTEPKRRPFPIGTRRRILEDPTQWEIQPTPSPEPEPSTNGLQSATSSRKVAVPVYEASPKAPLAAPSSKALPTVAPSKSPTSTGSKAPLAAPSSKALPTVAPSKSPTSTGAKAPLAAPSLKALPTVAPSPKALPTVAPSLRPTLIVADPLSVAVGEVLHDQPIRKDEWKKPTPALLVPRVDTLPSASARLPEPSISVAMGGWKIPKRTLTIQQDEPNSSRVPISMSTAAALKGSVAAVETDIDVHHSPPLVTNTGRAEISTETESSQIVRETPPIRPRPNAAIAVTGTCPSNIQGSFPTPSQSTVIHATRGAVRRITVMQGSDDTAPVEPCPSLDDVFRDVGFPEKRSMWNRNIKIMAVGISERYKKMRERGEFRKTNWKEVGKAALAAHNVAIGNNIQYSQQSPEGQQHPTIPGTQPARRPSQASKPRQRKPTISQPDPFKKAERQRMSQSDPSKKDKRHRKARPIHQGTSPEPEPVPLQQATSDLIVCDFTEVREKIAKAIQESSQRLNKE